MTNPLEMIQQLHHTINIIQHKPSLWANRSDFNGYAEVPYDVLGILNRLDVDIHEYLEEHK